jgi:hypothetical protein
MPSLWEKATINDPEMFWAIVSDFSPTLANFAKKLLNISPNSVPSERAFSVLKLQHISLRNRLSLTKLDYLYFLFMNRRVLDRKTMSYKRTIYDLTPTKKLAEENEILDQETIIEREGTNEDEEESTKAIEAITTFQRNGNTIKRRRLNTDDVREVEG